METKQQTQVSEIAKIVTGIAITILCSPIGLGYENLKFFELTSLSTRVQVLHLGDLGLSCFFRNYLFSSQIYARADVTRNAEKNIPTCAAYSIHKLLLAQFILGFITTGLQVWKVCQQGLGKCFMCLVNTHLPQIVLSNLLSWEVSKRLIFR